MNKVQVQCCVKHLKRRIVACIPLHAREPSHFPARIGWFLPLDEAENRIDSINEHLTYDDIQQLQL
jgi:hypothetical protein